MPTTLRSASTTATAPWSVFESRSIAVRASSSGPTLGASASMMSAAVFIRSARLFARTGGAQARRDRRDHVGGDHRLGAAEPPRGLLTGPRVGDHRGAGGGGGVEPAGE